MGISLGSLGTSLHDSVGLKPQGLAVCAWASPLSSLVLFPYQDQEGMGETQLGPLWSVAGKCCLADFSSLERHQVLLDL